MRNKMYLCNAATSSNANHHAWSKEEISAKTHTKEVKMVVEIEIGSNKKKKKKRKSEQFIRCNGIPIRIEK